MTLKQLFIGLAMILLSCPSMFGQTEQQDTLSAALVTSIRRLSLETGEIISTPEAMKSVASPIGEGDPIRWIQYLPGVSSGADGTSASYVRGGNMGGNIITFDGIPVYGYSHVLGLTTVLPNDAVKSLSFSKGGFSGNQGNFTSSHISITTRRPSEESRQNSVFINNFLAGLHISSPGSKRVSYSLSTRISPIGPEYHLLQKLMKGQFGNLNGFRAEVGDLYGRIDWNMKKGRSITASALTSTDVYGFRMPDNTKENMGWGNLITYLRYHSDISETSSDLTLTYNSFVTAQTLSNKYKEERRTFPMKSSLQELSFTGDFHRKTEKRNVLKEGFNIRYASFHTGNLAHNAPNTPAVIISGYLQDCFKTDVLNLEGTIRPTLFHSDTTMFSVDINLKGKWQVLPFLALEGTADLMSQYYHTLEGQPVGWSMDVIVPSETGIPAERMMQAYTGLEMVFGKHQFNAGAYIKGINNIIYFKDASTLFNAGVAAWKTDSDLGNGDSKGLELMYIFHGKDLFIQTSATVSKSTRKGFRFVNDGEPFHAPFDRRLVCNISAQWKGININFTWQDGNWINGVGESYTAVDPNGNIVGLEYFGPVNSHHMPSICRLDIGYKMEWRKNTTAHEMNVGVYNVLNHFNPFTVYYDTALESWMELALIPIMPNISYRIRF